MSCVVSYSTEALCKCPNSGPHAQMCKDIFWKQWPQRRIGAKQKQDQGNFSLQVCSVAQKYFRGTGKKWLFTITSTHLIWEGPQLGLDFSKLLVCILTPVSHLPQAPVSFFLVRFSMLWRNSECEKFLHNKLTFVHLSVTSSDINLVVLQHCSSELSCFNSIETAVKPPISRHPRNYKTCLLKRSDHLWEVKNAVCLCLEPLLSRCLFSEVQLYM